MNRFSPSFPEKKDYFQSTHTTGSTRRFHEFLGGRSLDSTPCDCTVQYKRFYNLARSGFFSLKKFHSTCTVWSYSILALFWRNTILSPDIHMPSFSTTGRPRIVWTLGVKGTSVFKKLHALNKNYIVKIYIFVLNNRTIKRELWNSVMITNHTITLTIVKNFMK